MFKPKPGELILEIRIPKDGLKQKRFGILNLT